MKTAIFKKTEEGFEGIINDHSFGIVASSTANTEVELISNLFESYNHAAEYMGKDKISAIEDIELVEE